MSNFTAQGTTFRHKLGSVGVAWVIAVISPGNFTTTFGEIVRKSRVKSRAELPAIETRTAYIE
ncbi:MAG: hypothetical protein C7B46_17555 [Sulfobacillus benefaciens]|uniref:Uncharacterized protein n=1 Tax=Sulfobacillus benefaciens TaxID=453960 RepID=A0A2T2X8H3_9FIRM|nr:MAG: hypothetical protein C7B46_17555 [Sulfobacillus benefaciens]